MRREPAPQTRRLGTRSLEQEQKWPDLIPPLDRIPESKLFEDGIVAQEQHLQKALDKLHRITELDSFDYTLNEESNVPYYQQYLQNWLFHVVLKREYPEHIGIVLKRIDPNFPYPPGQKRPIEIAADNKDWDCVLAFAEFPTDEADNAHYSVALTQAVAAGRLDVVTKLRAS